MRNKSILMFNLKNIISLVICPIVFLTGCGGSDTDVMHYFGKTEQEIREMLGEPSSGWNYEDDLRSRRGQKWIDDQCRRSDATIKKEGELSYLFDEKTLPKPFREMKFRFSDAGLCCQITGITQGYNDAEVLLKDIGLGDLEIEKTSSDELGFSYKMPPFEMVQVSRLSSLKRKYESFNLWDKDAGYPEKVVKAVTPEDIRARRFKTTIIIDGKTDDWDNAPPVMANLAKGDTPPDLKTLKMAVDDDCVYFLLETMGWAEPFTKVTSRFGSAFYHGSWGTILLDVDNERKTGDDIGDIGAIFYPRYLCGAEYKIQLQAGFKGEPQVNFLLKHWTCVKDKEGYMRNKWENIRVAPKQIAYEGAFLEFAIPKSILNIEKGDRTTVAYDESAGLKVPIVVREIILPIVESP